MTFGLPWALAGLLAVPLLILLERRRRRPRRAVWPSLLLWRDLPDDASARRRRIDPLLVAECLAAALLALAASEPRVARSGGGRRVTVLLDTSPAMQARRADGRTALEATRAEVERLRAALGPGDDLRVLETAGDLRVAAAALDPAHARVVASARPGVEAPGWITVGRAPEGDNVGIDAVDVEGGRVGFALACDGEARPVRVRIGDEERTVRTGAWVEAGPVDRIELLEPDNYAGDDRVSLRPLALRVRDETGSRRVRAALFEAGLRAREASPPDLTIRPAVGAELLSGPVHGADCVPEAGIFEGLLLEACVWEGVVPVSAAVRPLLRYRESVLAGWAAGEDGVLILGLPVGREWDEHGTLAVLVERAKRARAEAGLAPGEVLRGDRVVAPAPGFVATRGVDRPWDGRLPASVARAEGPAIELARPLAAAAAFALLAWLLLAWRAGSLGDRRARGIVARP